MSDEGSVTIGVTIDSSRAHQQINKLQSELNSAFKNITARVDVDVDDSEVKKLSNTLKGLGLSYIAIEASKEFARLAKNITTFSLGAAADFEQVQIAFSGIFKSASVGNEVLAQLQDFAAKTPYQFDQLTSSAQRLIGAFGPQFKDRIIPTLTTVGNVVATLGQSAESVNRITRALTQVAGKGRFQLEEANQISEALPGFNPVLAISQYLGKSTAETYRLIEAGAVSATDAINGLLAGMEKFPGAAGAMERQSQTLNGRISTLRDNVQILARTRMDSALAAAKGFVEQLIKVTSASGAVSKAFDSLDESIAGVISSFSPNISGIVENLSNAFTTLVKSGGQFATDVVPLIASALVPISEIIASLLDVGDALTVAFGPTIVTTFNAIASVLGAIDPSVLAAFVSSLIAMKAVDSVAKGFNALQLAITAIGTSSSAALGPIGLLIAAGAAIYTYFSTTRASESELSKAVSDTSAEFERNTTALIHNSDALQRINENGNAAAETFSLLGTTLSGALKDIKYVEESTNAIARLSDTYALFEGKVGGVKALETVGESFTALGAKDADVYRLIDAIHKLNATGARANSESFAFLPTKEDQADATAAFNAYIDGWETVQSTISGRSLERSVGAMKTIVETGAASTETLRQFNEQVRATIESIALEDPVADKVLSQLDKVSGIGFGQTVADLDTFLTKYAEAKKQVESGINPFSNSKDLLIPFANVTKALDGIADAADLVSTAVKNMESTFDQLNGKKIDLREAETSLQEFFDKVESKTDGFSVQKKIGVNLNIDEESGRTNSKLLADGLEQIRNQAIAVFNETGSREKALVSFELNTERLRQSYVNAGGINEEFNRAVNSGAYGDNKIKFDAELRTGLQTSLQGELDKLTAAGYYPKVVAQLQTALDEGQYEKVQNALTALGKLEIKPSAEVGLDGAALADAKNELDALTAVRSVGIEPKLGSTAAYDSGIAAIINAKNTATVSIKADPSSYNSTYNSIIRAAGTSVIKIKGAYEAGGMIPPRFMAGGFIDNASHIVTPAMAAQGPYAIYGEPSTYGEAFISMNPRYRERNLDLYAQVGNMLGVNRKSVENAQQHTSQTQITQVLNDMTKKFDDIIHAFTSLPPVTVVTNAHDGEAVASKAWHANKRRLAKSVGR